MKANQWIGTVAAGTMLCSVLALCACTAGAGQDTSEALTTDTSAAVTTQSSLAGVPTEDDIAINETLSDDTDGGHVIEVDATQDSYANVAVQKTGDSDQGDEADFYGDNAAVFATNGGTADLSQLVIKSDGTHANAVFSYGEGTTVNISDSVIETKGNCSGGLMTTGGATMNATNLSVSTEGNSSAAIRSDRGGGTVTVEGGSYSTSGTGSPAIYSTADITVSNAELTSTASQGVVVEGKNSVTLNNVALTADNTTKNSDKSETYQAVMIYQSMSGDADNGEASFTMNGGNLTNLNGDVFFVNNTIATIALDDVTIDNQDSEGVFLRAEAAGWGNEGENGGQVELKATNQTIQGDIVVDNVSKLNLYLGAGSSFTGALNASGEAGEVYVELSDGATWVLTDDSYISSLTCEASSIDLNGHTLFVNGKEYKKGTASTGDAITFDVSSTSSHGKGGTPPEEGVPPEGKASTEESASESDAASSSDTKSSSDSASSEDTAAGSDASSNSNSTHKKAGKGHKPGEGKGGTPPTKPSGDSQDGTNKGGTPPEKPSASQDS